MNVLISSEFEQQARQVRWQVNVNAALKEVVRTLENLRPENPTSHPMIHRLPNATEDIYVIRCGDLRFFVTIRGDDALLIGIQSIRINVSRGQRLNFAANGKAVSGVIVASKKTFGPSASVTVETESPIPNNAQLTIPDLPETGGCGLAHPVDHNGRMLVELSIGYAYIDFSTIGK